MLTLTGYLEASKRRNDTVTSLQETNRKLLEIISELKKAASADSLPLSVPLLSE